MKKIYEAPHLSEIRFTVEENLMVSVTNPDEVGDQNPEILPPINIFG